MSRVPRYFVDPNNPLSITQQVEEIRLVLDGDTGFGHPNDPNDITSTIPAGMATTSHNGFVENITGSWVEAEFGTVDGGGDHITTCYHNLFPDPNYILPVSGAPNVRWLVFGFSHDGDTVDAASTLSIVFQEGDTVAAASIELQLHVGGTRVVDDTHPVVATLFFTPAVRGMLEIP